MQLLLLLRKSSLQENLENSASRLNLLLAWLEDHFADEVNWDAVANNFLFRCVRYIGSLSSKRD